MKPTEMQLEGEGVWSSLLQHWSALGPPLRPSEVDLDFTRNCGNRLLDTIATHDATALVLGVTPELCELGLARVRRVIAVDQSAAMIGAIWPGPANRDHSALQADWSKIPLESESVDLALSDGSFTPLRYPDEHESVFAELHRLLRPRACVIMRCFVQGAIRETETCLSSDLRAARIRSFHTFKWRLAMALQTSSEDGVKLHAIWKNLTTELPDPVLAARAFSWHLEEIRTIESYRYSDVCYYFPTLEEQCRVAQRSGFTLIEKFTPDYELGDRCPTLVFQREGFHES